jgi:D-glycero-D-manno-heptose 1,7-bisphosphate phosphatase
MGKSKPALFLDRDGVVNRDYGYVFEKKNFDFYPEIFEICSLAQKSGMAIVIVTNQSGIGRGYFSEGAYQDLTEWMILSFKNHGIDLTDVLHAPENPDSDLRPVLDRRKPSPIMFLEAALKFNLNLADSIMIGDNELDMLAAQRAGIECRILIGAYQGTTVASEVVEDHGQCFEVFKNYVTRSKE